MLEQQRLGLARDALLWALGGVVAVRRDGIMAGDRSDAEIAEFFDLWARQPAATQISARPILAEGSEVVLSTVVLGVEVVARIACNHDSTFLAEAILAAFESFLSTSLNANVFPYRERIEFTVYPSADAAAPPTFQIDDLTRAIAVTHGAGSLAGAPNYPTFTSWLQELLIHLSLGMLFISDPKKWIEHVARDEAGFERALALSAVAVTTRNVFGDQPRVLLSDWIDPTSERHLLERKTALELSPEATAATVKVDTSIRYGKGDSPNSYNSEAGGHADRRVLSPINIPLWDRAKWQATGFSWVRNEPPFLMLGFYDYESGKAIFREWRKLYGPVDERDALRITIVREIDRNDPPAYVIMLSSEIEGRELSGTMLYLSSRINRMKPKDRVNLDHFLKAYAQTGTFVLAPLPLDALGTFQPMDPDLVIVKHRLIVRDAWTIGDNDPELVCIHIDDTPIIPKGVTDPPINRTLERLRRMQ